jgi:HK97 family phage portal protein
MAGLIRRLFGRTEPGERRSWGADGWGAMRLGGSTYGMVSPRHAESLAAVAACVSLISSAIASLPASLMIDGPDGRAPAPPTAPAWRLLARPWPGGSWPGLVSAMVASYLQQGNALHMLQYDGRGAVVALVPVPWTWVSPQVISGTGGPRLVFDLMQSSPESQLLGLPRRLLDTDTLHVKARSDLGAVGRSVLSRAAGVIAEGLEIQNLAASNWQNGLRTSGIISLQAALTKDGQARLKERLAAFKNDDTMGVLILDQSAKYEAMSLSSADAEFLASRQFSVAEVCRLFNVPEPLVQLGPRVPADPTAYVTAFAQLCLAPIIADIESEFDNSVLPAGMHLSLDLDGMMRGSFSATVAGLAALKQSGIVTANDARAELDWPPIAGGDVLGTGPAPNYPADFAGSTTMHKSPGPTGNGVAEPGSNHNQGSNGAAPP